jgi:hypothetical protein
MVDTDPARPRGRAWATVGRPWLPVASAAVIAAVVFWFAHYTLVDDAYITLAYARNLAFHLHWGLIQSVTANTATSPLNVLLLGVLTVLTRQPLVSLGILYVLSVVAMEYGVRRAARAVGLPGWTGLLAVVITAVNPLLISSIGLEIALGGGLIGLLLAASVTHRPVWFGVVAGLLVLTRPDLLIIVLVVFVLRPRFWRGWWRGLLGLLAVTVPWYLWSWVVLGSALPDTLLLKVNQGAWGGHQFGTGPVLYDQAYPTDTILSFLPAAVGAFLALCWLVVRVVRPTERVRRLDRFFALPVAGGLHYVAYSLLSVPPYHWYYGTGVIVCGVYLAVVIGALAAPADAPALARVPAVTGVVLAAALAVVSVVDYAGDGLPRSAAQITSNWATSAQYARIGADVARLAGGRVVSAGGEIGAIAYFCDCTVVDQFSDRGDVVARLPAWLNGMGPVGRKLTLWNFHFLDRSQRALVATLGLAYTDTPAAGALGTWRVSSPWTDAPGHWHYVSLVLIG